MGIIKINQIHCETERIQNCVRKQIVRLGVLACRRREAAVVVRIDRQGLQYESVYEKKCFEGFLRKALFCDASKQEVNFFEKTRSQSSGGCTGRTKFLCRGAGK